MFRSRKNWRSVRLTARGWVVLLVGIIALPLAYVGAEADATIPPPVTAALGEAGSAARTEARVFETPCEQRERTARGIPADTPGLMAYTYAHLDGTQADAELQGYWDALDTCNRTEPVARWNWAGRVLVSVEYLP